jgi:hypothetical protein
VAVQLGHEPILTPVPSPDPGATSANGTAMLRDPGSAKPTMRADSSYRGPMAPERDCNGALSTWHLGSLDAPGRPPSGRPMPEPSIPAFYGPTLGTDAPA